MKKKILFIGNCYYVVFRFRKELVKKCVDEGYEVWTAFPNASHGEKEQGSDTAGELGCHFVELKIRRRSSDPIEEAGLYFKLKKLMTDIKPDIILTFTVKPNLYGGILAHRLGIPYIINVTGLGSALGKEGLLSRILLKLTMYSMKNASCVFFQNEHDRNYFRKRGYGKNNVEMLPGSGVNLKEYTVLPYPDDSVIRFLYIARVMKEKGIDEFLELAEYYKDRTDIEFHICGDCEEDYSDLLQKLTLEKIITYHGQVSEVRKYIGMSHCIILPTYYHEGIPNSLLEAMACGRPVITTDHPGCRETVEEGKNGYLIRIHDSRDLIGKTDEFLQLKEKDKRIMGMAGRKKAEREFDRESVVKKYIDCIRMIIL